jgi:tetratricopeptide (TPR) repeat protein
VRIDGGRGVWGAILIALLSAATGLHAQGCEPWVARIISVQGPVMVERFGAPRAQAAGFDDTVCPGDRVRVGAFGRAAVQLANEAETPIRLGEGTTIIFPAPEPEKPFLLKLIEGVMHVLSRMPQALTIETPIAAASIEGTEFVLEVSKSEAELWVFEGQVRYSNPQGQLEVRSGEGALARPGRAPVRRVLVKPREAVEWALYYPPLVDPRPESYPPALRAALLAYRANDLPTAFAALERVPARDRDGRYLLLRAGLLMSVGQVAKAEVDLAEAERADPKSGGATALRSVIALVRDQKENALRLAESGADLDPDSPLPQAALSYAYQGRFEIEKALKHARRAVELAPEDALLWARVSELELSRGDLDAALEAAQKAEALSPALARTQTVLGFAYLTRIEVDKAKSAFERAIQGDPADPLSRLGIGLAKIRDGDLDEGTREIETAASLDPNNSLVRSYLGKAYFEQKRGGLASTEFEQAKLLDPKDPTPWFYDAIHKQTTNRPVEALRDLQNAIELNDNRAVYRSTLLLDQDLAARSASLGRIYRELGFEQLALVEGWKSVGTDPANYSSHRFLADSYATRSRHEIARVSELLQSQLLQPINITPIQPQLGESNLLLVEGLGPRGSSFNEFNPLFARDKFALQASGVVGTQDAYADEVVQSGLWGPMSYSLGQFHSETQGFRENNDLEQNIYTAFVQGAFTPNLSVQGEFRRRQTEHGDLELNADGTFDRFSKRQEDRDAHRLGIHYAPWPHSDFIASATYFDGEEKQQDEFFERSSVSRGYNAEGQYLFHSPQVNAVLGGGYYDFDRDVTSQNASRTSMSEFTRRHGSGYLYTYLRYPAQMTWTLGVSFDSFDDFDDQPSTNLEIGSLSELNEKLGVAWDLTPNTTLRLATFKALKRSLVVDQTIEPTQVAGFNQFFDDPNGTVSRRYGVGLDHRFSSNVYGGIEVSRRDLEVPVGGQGIKDRREDLLHSYLYWTPHPKWALKLEFEREDFDRVAPFGEPPSNTHLLPFGIGFFDPSGFFARVVTTYVNQEVQVSAGDKTRNEFVLVDTSIGYRLPKRYGILSLGVKNLFDEDFSFESLGLRTQQDETPPFVPERIVFGQITLSFY